MVLFGIWLYAAIAYVVGSNIHGHTDWFERGTHIGSRSPAFDNNHVSGTINDALTKFGFDADEAESFRAGYHVVVDQFDDNEDESRKLLSDVLLKVLNAPDVETVDGSLDVLGEKFDGLIPRGVDTAAGSKDGVKPDHIIVHESVNDITPRDTTHVSVVEAMATWLDSAESLNAGNGRIPERLEEKLKEVASKPEKREEAIDPAGPESVKPEEKLEQNEPPVEHLTPAGSPTRNPFLEKFNTTGHRGATPEDARRIFSQIQFLAKLKAMGLLRKPTGKRVLTIEEIFQAIQSRKPKVNTDINTTPTPTADGPAENHEPIPVPEGPRTHSKRSVPKVPDCDCEATIEAVKDPKPEGGMTYKWFQNWQHKAVNTSCVHPCVDNAIDRFTKTVIEYQAFEARIDKEYQDYLNHPLNDTSLSKREEPTVLPEPAKAKLVMPSQTLPKPAHPFTYRDWYRKTQKTGDFCTCHVNSSPFWSWYMAFTGVSQRCKSFCSQSVKPFLEKEKEIDDVPKEPVLAPTTVEEPVEGSSPSPSVASVPVSQVSNDGTQPEPVESEPEVVDDES